ncbi:hypothetical protein [Nocardioides daphniae]|uniref:Thioesterase n=1 Tax=Nocardioides daphniae TaxID=402297 RepID=A0A4P7UA94_9ACTN|nr:hypothetical protein [Nocardioides daphniae]QCC76158.1 hypothetical protein E2C04_01195 [Nocardioides daphniae]GGD09487.1 hypothetical protein GCM10007231_05450 [Nocardioides daphniae]
MTIFAPITVPKPRSSTPETDLTAVAPLMSDYLTDGVHQDRFSLTSISLTPTAVRGMLRLDSFGVSPEDVGGFHLTAPTCFRMAGQLVVIHTHWLAGLEQKSFEVWVRDHSMRHQRPVRDPHAVDLTMTLVAARLAHRHPGLVRVDYEAAIGDGDVVGRTTSYVDLTPDPQALRQVRATLEAAGTWSD